MNALKYLLKTKKEELKEEIPKRLCPETFGMENSYTAEQCAINKCKKCWKKAIKRDKKEDIK